MTAQDTAAVVALLEHGRRAPRIYADMVEQAGSARSVLDEELSHDRHGQTSLLAPTVQSVLAAAQEQIKGWNAAGITLLTVLDPGYPENLRAAHDRPPLIFAAGELRPEDARAVAVIGSRRASPDALERAGALADHLVKTGFTVVSGLAAGIDTAAHTAALNAGGRTVAVLGTGLEHAYPPQNQALQRRIADRCAVVSHLRPDTPPGRETFPARNAVMSGLSLGTVIVAASVTSGARIQARQALAQGRPVFLAQSLLAQQWADQLATRPGVDVFDFPGEVSAALERLHDANPLTG